MTFLKYLFVAFTVCLSIYCFKDFKIEIPLTQVVSSIESKLPLTKVIENNRIAINKIDLSIENQNIIANILFDLEIKDKIKINDIQGIINLNHKIDFYSKGVVLTINDFEIINPGKSESKSKVINSLLSVLDNNKDNILGLVNGKSIYLSNIFNHLLKEPVYYFTGYKGFFLNNILIHESLAGASFIVVLNILPLAIFCIAISIFLLFREIGLFFIFIYQKFISPRKGYCCANKYHNGVDSCSESVRKVMKEKGFFAGINEYFRVTKECKETYHKNKYLDNSEKDCSCGSSGKSSNVAKTSSSSSGGCADASCDSLECGLDSCDAGACHVGHC